MDKYSKNAPHLRNVRRKLRRNATPAEAAFWNIVKGKKVAGLQFRRQYSIDNYILDFYCPEVMLAVELDGNYHNQRTVSEYDYVRERELADKYGIRTLRFENKDVFDHPDDIIQYIIEEISK